MDRFDTWSVAGVILIIVIAIWGVRMLKQRLDEQRYQQELSDLEFEGSVFSELGPGTDSSQDLNFVSGPQGAAPARTTTSLSDIAIPVEASPPMASNLEPLPADQLAANVMQQLQKSGTLQSVEGYVELHGNPKGTVILLLRGGKRALLVPHMESEAFIRRNSRRVDLIIMTGTDGKGVTVTPLEELLSQNLLPG